MSSDINFEEMVSKWNELNIQAGMYMAKFDFDNIKKVRAHQVEVEDAVFNILMEKAPDNIKNQLPEDCSQMEVGVEVAQKKFYFVMEDPEFEESDDIILKAFWIDNMYNIGIEKNFKIEDDD
ncbi:MAG: hypothetical protein ACTSR8_18365 [Promethearchaeota archaeon]